MLAVIVSSHDFTTARMSEASIVPRASHRQITPTACPGRVLGAASQVRSCLFNSHSSSYSLVSHAPSQTVQASFPAHSFPEETHHRIEDKVGLMHFTAYQLSAVLRYSSCRPLPCDRISRSPWWCVTSTTHMAALSPFASRQEGDPVVCHDHTSERNVGIRLIPLANLIDWSPHEGGCNRRPERLLHRLASAIGVVTDG